MRKYLGIISLVGMLLLAGCGNAESSISSETISLTVESPSTEEAAITSTEVGMSDIQAPEQYTFLSKEQKEQIKTDSIQQACTTLSNCLSNDTELINDSVTFKANTANGIQKDSYCVATQNFSNEVVYFATNGDDAEVWHKLTFDLAYVSTQDYLAGLKNYLKEYGVTFSNVKNVAVCSNIYNSKQWIYLAATENDVWIGVADSSLDTFSILDEYR